LGCAVFGTLAYGLTTATLVTAMPGLMITLARVSNESLAVVLGTALLLLMVRRHPGPLILGAMLGLALLTKAYFLTTAFAVLVVLGLRAVACSIRRSIQRRRVSPDGTQPCRIPCWIRCSQILVGFALAAP
jgi:hypothetical protein